MCQTLALVRFDDARNDVNIHKNEPSNDTWSVKYCRFIKASLLDAISRYRAGDAAPYLIPKELPATCDLAAKVHREDMRLSAPLPSPEYKNTRNRASD